MSKGGEHDLFVRLQGHGLSARGVAATSGSDARTIWLGGMTARIVRVRFDWTPARPAAVSNLDAGAPPTLPPPSTSQGRSGGCAACSSTPRSDSTTDGRAICVALAFMVAAMRRRGLAALEPLDDLRQSVGSRERWWPLVGAAALVAVAACSREERTIRSDAGADQGAKAASPASAPAAVEDAAGAMPPMPVLHGGASYASLCPTIVALAEAGADPSTPSRHKPETTVMFRTMRRRTPSSGSAPATTDFVALIDAPGLLASREVFSIGAEGDPYDCCANANVDGLDVRCGLSGVVIIEGRATARREGDALVLRWCTADLSTSRVLDRGDARAPLRSGASLRFRAAARRCEP